MQTRTNHQLPAVIQAGFTLIELLLTISIMGILLSLATFNLFHSQNTTTVQTAGEMLIADLKSQQTKAMNGTTAGGNGSFGVHVDGTSTYTLFQGTTYTSGASTNFPITIDTINFSCPACTNGDIIFSPLSGETAGATINLAHAGGILTETIVLNKYGAVVTQN